MAKKYNPKKAKLSSYEQGIEDKLNHNKLKRPLADTQARIKAAASETLRELKSERANIRMSESDMDAIRSLAEKTGLPYQTLIAHILHLYVTDQLVNINEVKKMVEAGVFNKKIG